MEQAYKNSILMIKMLKIKLSKKQYNQLAVSNNLLSSESLEYISGMKFNALIKSLLKEVE